MWVVWRGLQIQVYVPQQQHPAYGVVRTVVKDSMDWATSVNRSTVYLDSDGTVNNNGGNRSVKVRWRSYTCGQYYTFSKYVMLPCMYCQT